MIMISLEAANSILSNCSINTLVSHKVNIDVALNRVLVEDVFTDMDYHSFRKSAMDGYTILQEDICNPVFSSEINHSMQAEPLEYFGSGHLHSYQKADGMGCFPIGLVELKKGTIIDVRPI